VSKPRVVVAVVHLDQAGGGVGQVAGQADGG